jgi:hypothetical protein
MKTFLEETSTKVIGYPKKGQLGIFIICLWSVITKSQTKFLFGSCFPIISFWNFFPQNRGFSQNFFCVKIRILAQKVAFKLCKKQQFTFGDNNTSNTDQQNISVKVQAHNFWLKLWKLLRKTHPLKTMLIIFYSACPGSS